MLKVYISLCTLNGAITDFYFNPSAFKAEFLKLKGWEQYIA
jgi:hypothetical protein